MSKKERFATHCEYCFREFEAESRLEAILKSEEHEKTCDMREPIMLPVPAKEEK